MFALLEPVFLSFLLAVSLPDHGRLHAAIHCLGETARAAAPENFRTLPGNCRIRGRCRRVACRRGRRRDAAGRCLAAEADVAARQSYCLLLRVT